MKKKFNWYAFFKYFSLIGYILCLGVLIVESCINGDSSIKQSSSLGNIIANAFNNLAGDQADEVMMESLTITNKIDNAYIKDEYMIETKIEPSNATHKGLKYTSSDENIAKVSNEGRIFFLNKGIVTITATSEKYTELEDSFTLNVEPVLLQSLSSSIRDITPDEEGIYTLTLGKKYTIDTEFVPTNTTDKELNYSIDNNTYINLDDNVLDIKKISHGQISTISIKQNNIFNEIKIKTTAENIIQLQDISIEIEDIHVGELNAPYINFYPSNATFTDYVLSSSNNNVEIINNKLLGKKEGKSTITITSKEYPSICKSIDINILKAPLMTSFNLDLISKIPLNKTHKINILPEPYYASTPNYSEIHFNSSSSILTIDKEGIITPLQEGKTTISATYNDVTITKEIQIYKTTSSFVDFSIENAQEGLYTSNTYDIGNVIKINSNSSYVDEFEYYLQNDSKGKIENNTIKFNSAGEFKVYIVHTPSFTIKEITLYSIDIFDITDENDNIINQITLASKKEFGFKLTNETNTQSYILEISHPEVFISKRDDTYYINNYNNTLNTTLKITPCINNYPLSNLSKTVSLSLNGVITTSLSYKVINRASGKEIVPKLENTFRLPIIGNYQVVSTLDENTTLSDITYTSSNTSVASIDSNGVISVYKTGIIIITLTDNISLLSTSFQMNLYNYITLQTDNHFTLSGEKVTYNQEEDTYILTNGYPASLKVNFGSSSTYRIATYKSNNTDIISISDSGAITPIKTGETQLLAIIDDGMLDAHIITINVRIIKRDLIENMDEFHMLVRKALGHFGAFLIFGIFTSLTFMFFFKKTFKRDIIITSLNGFIISAGTELIQLITPGRTGSITDALLDLTGFIIGALIIVIILQKKKQIDLTKK